MRGCWWFDGEVGGRGGGRVSVSVGESWVRVGSHMYIVEEQL